MLFGLFGGSKEVRSNPLEDPSISLNDPRAWYAMFGGIDTFTGEPVTEETALSIPAIWCAVNAIAGTLASLPLHLYSGSEDNNKKRATSDPLYAILHDRWNPEQTSHAGRKHMATRLLLSGRATIFIERNKAGRVMNLWPFVHRDIRRINGKLTYTREMNTGPGTTSATVTYDSSEVIDLVLMPAADGISHINPIQTLRNTIGLMRAAERFGSTLFNNGGVPPLALNGPPMSPAAASRAANDVEEALRRTKDEGRNILVTPQGYKLEPIGIDPAKQQVLELRKFLISEVSRIFNIAPAILHDLSTGTYSNVEQQDLAFTKHTIRPLTELIEQELNLKLFSARNSNFVEFNLDGLMRGDFKARADAMHASIHAALITPNEARALENREPLEGGDELYIQAATIPLRQAGQNLIKDGEPATKGVPVGGDPLANPLPPGEVLPADRLDDATPTDGNTKGGPAAPATKGA